MRLPEAIVESKPKLHYLPIDLKPRIRKGALVDELDATAPQGYPLVRRYIDVVLKTGNRPLLHIPLKEDGGLHRHHSFSTIIDVDDPFRGP